MGSDPTELLTSREQDCLRLIGSGMSAKGVASELGITPSTVEKHLASTRRKLGVGRTVEALRVVLERAPRLGSAANRIGFELVCDTCSDKARRTAASIMSCKTRSEAWQQLQDHLTGEGYDRSILGVVAEPFGQLTNGARILENSFGDDVKAFYDVADGANGDPVAKRIAGTITVNPEPFFCDSTQIVREYIENVPSHVVKMMTRFLDMEFQRLLVVPTADISTGAPFSLTLHINSNLESEIRAGSSPDIMDIRFLAEAYWTFLKSKRHLSKMCGLTQRQTDMLVFSARGFRVEEAADRMGVSSRSAEKTLEQARKRLGARTTPAAIFRANVYGLL